MAAHLSIDCQPGHLDEEDEEKKAVPNLQTAYSPIPHAVTKQALS